MIFGHYWPEIECEWRLRTVTVQLQYAEWTAAFSLERVATATQIGTLREPTDG